MSLVPKIVLVGHRAELPEILTRRPLVGNASSPARLSRSKIPSNITKPPFSSLTFHLYHARWNT